MAGAEDSERAQRQREARRERLRAMGQAAREKRRQEKLQRKRLLEDIVQLQEENLIAYEDALVREGLTGKTLLKQLNAINEYFKKLAGKI